MSITCVLGKPSPLANVARSLIRLPGTVEDALRAGPDANPPLNMHRAFIFQGALVCGTVASSVALRGRQARREMDERVLMGDAALLPGPEKAQSGAYQLQDQGADTVEANERLGFKPDLRNYGIGTQILLDLGLKIIRIMTNNPRKLVGVEGYGLKLLEGVRLHAPENAENSAYLQTKRAKLGHLLAS